MIILPSSIAPINAKKRVLFCFSPAHGTSAGQTHQSQLSQKHSQTLILILAQILSQNAS